MLVWGGVVVLMLGGGDKGAWDRGGKEGCGKARVKGEGVFRL